MFDIQILIPLYLYTFFLILTSFFLRPEGEGSNGDENLFRTDENYYYFLEKYTYHVHPVADTFAYCLMPNHFHLMVRVREVKELLTLPGFETQGWQCAKPSAKNFLIYSMVTHKLNKRYDRKRSLFMDSFERSLVDSDEYFHQLIVYIHNTPHHGFVERPEDWIFSSWHAYLCDKKTKIKKKERDGLVWRQESFFKSAPQIKTGRFDFYF